MDLTELRWFLTAAEQGNVTRAAAALYISQPGLSRAIARLERELGVRLFDREGRNVRLNRNGILFREHAARLLAEADAARRALAQAGDPDAGEVALAFLHTLGTWLVPDLLRRYRALRPRVTFQLTQDRAETIAEAVQEGRADLGFTSPRPTHPALAWKRLAVERLHLAVPADHPLASRRRVRLADVAGEAFVALRRGYGLRSITDELHRRAGVQPAIAFEGEDIATLRGLVAAGLGLAIVPAPDPGGAEASGPVRHVAIAEPAARREIGAIWVAERTHPPVVEAFRRFVVDVRRRAAAGDTPPLAGQEPAR